MASIKEKHSSLLRIVHWINVPLLVLMIWSGVLIYWADQAFLKIPNSFAGLKLHHRLAEGMGWHFFIMWFFMLNGLVYLCYLFGTGRWRAVAMDLKSLKKLVPFILHDLRLRKEAVPYDGDYNPAQRLAYSIAIVLGIGSVVTGLAIHKPVQLGLLTAALGGYEAARFEHFLCMTGLSLFILLHLLQVARAGWNNLRSMIAGYELEK